MTDFEAAEAEALIALRGQLEEAITRASDSTLVGRRITAVLLDGAAEAAIATCLARFNLTPDRDTLENSYSQLIQHLKNGGKLDSAAGVRGWPDVRRLRRVRNDAQHHQIPPDHETLVTWSASVQRFVEDAVRRSFGRELSLVTRAETIRDEELRSGFAEAESNLQRDATVDTVRSLMDVFKKALSKWKAEHEDATRQSTRRPMRDEFGIVQTVEAATQYAEDMLLVAPFALDLGEYVWWQSLVQSVSGFPEPAPVSIQDARRAMAFVFTWILRWEAFSATYTRDRLGRRRPPRPPASPLPDGAPTLLREKPRVEMVMRRRYDNAPDEVIHELVVRYAAGSEDDASAQAWRRPIANALSAYTQRGSAPWEEAMASGWGEIRLRIDPETVDPVKVRAALESVLDEASRAKREEREAEARDRAEVERAFLPLRDALQTVLSSNSAPAFAEVRLQRRIDADGVRHHSVVAVFEDSLYRSARRRISGIPSPGALPQPKIGTLLGNAYELPLSTPRDVALQGARSAVSLLEAERCRIEEIAESRDRERSQFEARFRRAFEEDDAG